MGLQKAPERLAVAAASKTVFSLCVLTLLLLNAFTDKVNVHGVKTCGNNLGLNSFLLIASRKEGVLFQGFAFSLSTLDQLVAGKFSSSIS